MKKEKKREFQWLDQFIEGQFRFVKGFIEVSVCVVFEQFVVGEDGSWGLLYEQATAEGPPIATLLHHILDYW